MNIPNHVGISPDGNRRYAREHRLPLENAYELGAQKALEVVDSCLKREVKEISFYGTSASNLLKRPKGEIAALQSGVVYFCHRLTEKKIPFHLIGDPKDAVIETYAELFRESVGGAECPIHIDAAGADNIRGELAPLFDAIIKLGVEKVWARPEHFIRTAGVGPIDLVIRTGNRKRLSNFLPWQSGNAELYFVEALWPNFELDMLEQAFTWFNEQARTRGS